MNILDENFSEEQRPMLRTWGIPFRQIGREISHLGIKDEEIIPLLHRHRHATFLTQDRGFFKQALCHPLYCIAFLDVPQSDVAHSIRRLLRHERFESVAKRMGIVARVHHKGIHFWQSQRGVLRVVDWVRVV